MSEDMTLALTLFTVGFAIVMLVRGELQFDFALERLGIVQVLHSHCFLAAP